MGIRVNVSVCIGGRGSWMVNGSLTGPIIDGCMLSVEEDILLVYIYQDSRYNSR